MNDTELQALMGERVAFGPELPRRRRISCAIVSDTMWHAASDQTQESEATVCLD